MQIARHFAVFLADALVTFIAGKPVLFVLGFWTKETQTGIFCRLAIDYSFNKFLLN